MKKLLPATPVPLTDAQLNQQYRSFSEHQLVETLGPDHSLEKFKAFVLAEVDKAPIYKNDKYQVAMYGAEHVAVGPDFPPMIHLSIKRLDKKPIDDWRDLQEIKNQLVGPEHEAVQLYPAESRLVDSANQYHLWVLADAGIQFPFGFHGCRIVSDNEGGGSRQRPGSDRGWGES